MSRVVLAPANLAVPSPKPFPSVSLLAATYATACLVCFLLAFFALNRQQDLEWKALSKSTLLYTSNSQPSMMLAAQVSSRLHIQTLDLLRPESGKAVLQMTGQSEVLSPSLVIPGENGPMLISGGVAVNQELQRFDIQTSPFLRVRWALVFMALLIGLAIIFETEISSVAAFLPVLGLASIAALWGRCLLCSSGNFLLSTLAPIAGLIYMGGGQLYSPGRPNHAAYFTFAFFAFQQPFLFCKHSC